MSKPTYNINASRDLGTVKVFAHVSHYPINGGFLHSFMPNGSAWACLATLRRSGKGGEEGTRCVDSAVRAAIMRRPRHPADDGTLTAKEPCRALQIAREKF